MVTDRDLQQSHAASLGRSLQSTNADTLQLPVGQLADQKAHAFVANQIQILPEVSAAVASTRSLRDADPPPERPSLPAVPWKGLPDIFDQVHVDVVVLGLAPGWPAPNSANTRLPTPIWRMPYLDNNPPPSYPRLRHHLPGSPMARQCPSCSRWFKSKQAIRAHLRFCEAYRERKAAAETVVEGETTITILRECGSCQRIRTTEADLCPYCGDRSWNEIWMPPPWHFCPVCGRPAARNYPLAKCVCGRNTLWLKIKTLDDPPYREFASVLLPMRLSR